MKKLLCLLLTLLLIHPVLAEDALDAPDAASLLSCADGTVLAVSADLRVLRRDSAGDWALILSAEQISAACPPRFMPDAANALLLPGENGAYALLLLPDTSGQIAVLSLTGATCELTRVFADFLPTDSEMTAQWTLLSAARAGNTLYAAFSSNFATYSTYALSLADGSSFPLSDAPIRFLMPLADGQLLACVNPPISSIDESCFALLDADSGESSRLCALPAHKAYAGFALDGDSLYFTDGETIYCAASPYDAVESVGYLPSLDTSARLPALMVDNCYCVCNAELGFFAAQLHTAPRCTLRVDARLSNVNRALVSQYLRAHPDVAVVYAPHNASTAPEYRQHMESGDALDIYAFTLPNESFIPLRDKGDLLDLRLLMGADTLDSLLPQVLAPLEKAGGLFAIPCGAPSVSCWFLDQSSLESLGLTDVPATYADLMTLISTYLTDFASDSDVALADNPGGMADSLFQQLFWAQLARCEASGVLPTFTDADFVAALRQYIALRPALVDYETRWLAERSSSLGDLGDTGGIVTVLSVSSSQSSLLHLNTSLTPSKTDEVPLLLSFSEGGALLIPMTYSVLAVNRRSAYPDDAASLLSYLLDNQPYNSKLALLPDYAALLPNPAYTEAAQELLDDEALYTQYRATLSPLEQKQAEDILTDARAALHQIPPNVYSAAEIATYHARLNHAHLLESSFWVSGDQHVSTLRQRLLDGECTVETFVQELTRIVQMMTLENGVSS